MARRSLPGALLAALVAAALSVDTRVGTHRYDTDFGTNEGGWQPPDHGTTGFQIWTLDQDFEKCAPPPPRFTRARYRGPPLTRDCRRAQT